MQNSKKASSRLHLAIAVGGIYGTFLYFGILQEKLYRTDYGNTGEKFKFSWTVIFFQALFSWITAKSINTFYYKQKKSSFPRKLQIEIAAFYALSMFGSNQALKFIPYVVQALMKSSKVLSVMLVSKFAGTETFSKMQYFSGLLITTGIVIFNLLEKDKKNGKHTQSISIIGLILLLVSLFSDGMTSSKQSEARNKYKPSMFEMMESSNIYAILFAFLYGVGSFELIPAVQYLWNYPECFTDLVILAIMGTIGQCFVYFTIIYFNSFMLSVITTTRKFFTVISSILIFGYEISGFQWMSIILVFIGVGMELFEGKHGKEEKKQSNLSQEQHRMQSLEGTSTKDAPKVENKQKRNGLGKHMREAAREKRE